MNEVISYTARILGVPESAFRKESANEVNEVYVTVPEDRFRLLISEMSGNFDLVSLFCVQDFRAYKGFTLFYVFEKIGYRELIILERPLSGNQATSIARRLPSACWYEREITDGFGVEFTNAFDKRKLFLHETYPSGFHPLLKSFENRPVKTRQDIPRDEEYVFNELKGEGVYQIPVGPVHAGIIEPGHFRFSVIGETIFNLEIRMFYKHRGVEKLAEGKTPTECLPVAESISGDESAANAVGFCLAVEKICHTPVPKRAAQLRTILLELERIYSHLGDMAGMITDVAYPVGASNFFVLREEILRRNAALSGSRFLKGILTVGGLRCDIERAALNELYGYLERFPSKLKEALDLVRRSPWVVDRLETTGVIRKDILGPLHITGPAARASGAELDTRLDHPYGVYPELDLQKRVLQTGDVMSRFEVKAAEILDSVDMVNHLMDSLETGEILEPFNIRDGFALSLVEAPRGQNCQWLNIKNGVIDRYKVRTASYCNWRAIEHAVMGNIVPDFPLINKSLNLSYAGTDL